MNTTIQAKNRILSFALAICLLLTMSLYLPGPVEVSAALPQNDGSAEGKPYDGIDFDALVDNGVYYGVYDHYNGSGYPDGDTPILWRVMGEEDSSGKLTLLSEYVLDTHVFNSSYYGGNAQNYVASELNTWLNGTFATNAFEQAETNGIVPVDVVTGMYDRSSGTHYDVQDYYPQYAYDDYGNNYSSNNSTYDVNTGPWPKTATGQQVYLTHGGYDNDKVYWEAGNTRDATYELASSYSGNIASYKNGSTTSYWLRSPYSSHSYSALYVFSTGNVTFDYVFFALGVRPAFQLNPSSIIFASEIKSTASEDWETYADGTYYSDAAGVGANFKFTIVDNSLSIINLDAPTKNNLDGDGTEILPIASGGTLNLTGTISGGADNLVYKIVQDNGGSREIVGYGTGTATDITIDGVANVTDGSDLSASGDYTLYVWAQNNNGTHSHEGSEPLCFPLEVIGDNDATLSTVAGKTITTISGTGTTAGDPLLAAISLGQSSWPNVADSDLVTKHPEATAALYDDNTYANPDSPITLNDPTTDLYIKVTAKDGTEQYYIITVMLVTDPATATLTMIQPNSDTVEVDIPYTKTIEVIYTGGSAPLGFSASGLPSTLNIDTSSGTISGTPDAVGTHTITVTAKAGDLSDSKTFTLTVDSSPVTPYLELDAPVDDTVNLGDPYFKTLSVTYTGSGTLTYDIDELPAGVGYDPNTGVISGTPTEDGEFDVEIEVSDGTLPAAIGGYKLTVMDNSGGSSDNNNGNNATSTSRSSSRSSGNGGSNVRTEPKTTLPATAFSWDAARTLTIDHERITALGLLSVQWDGMTLTRGEEYTVHEGSVIVRFAEDFISAQAAGDHTVRVEFLNHTGETTVTLGGAASVTATSTEAQASADHPDNDTHNPNTGGGPDGGYSGDNPNTGDGRGIWPALLLGGVSAAALVFYRGKQTVKAHD